MINRRNFIKTSLLGSSGLLAGDVLSASVNMDKKKKIAAKGMKNAIWILSDQHRVQAMGHQGDVNAKTPNLDRMAAEGVTFMSAYSGCPWSTPFRGSLLTSRYPHRAVYRTPQHLDSTLPLVSDAFNEEGYTTAFFGKWHLNGHNKRVFVPKEERGRFDVWIAYENNNRQYDSWVHGHDLWGREDTIADAEKLSIYETDALVDKAIDFIKRRPKNHPFFLIISVQPPHDPYIAPPEFMEKYSANTIELRLNVPPVKREEEISRKDLAGYYAQIENLDYNIGRLRQALEDLNLLETTHMSYFSDHGDCHGSHGYRRKSSPWQESIRIPCIFRPAGITITEHISEAMFNHIDIAPTTLGLCGIKPPIWMSGTDFSHYLTGKQAPKEEPDAVLLQHIYPKDFLCLDRPWRGIVTKDGWKYVVIEHQPIMLFNLNEDPYEMNNMVYFADKKIKIKRAELAHKLQKMLGDVGDTFLVSQ